MSTRNLRTDAVALLVVVLVLLIIAPAMADGTGDPGGDPTPGGTVPAGPSLPEQGLRNIEQAPVVVPPVPIPTWVSVVLARLSHILL